eukprot:2695369-Prymnesium_polylepis.1
MPRARCCAAMPTRRVRCTLHVAAMRRLHGGADARCTLLRCADHTAAAIHAARCCAATPTRRLRYAA